MLRTVHDDLDGAVSYDVSKPCLIATSERLGLR